MIPLFTMEQVHKPLEYVRQSFPDAIALDKLVVNASLLHNLEANLEDIVSNRTYMDALITLPPILSHSKYLISSPFLC